jgi:DMSO/TMAO reductase YedYZ molybdopterin-dependent catalytic subunit
VPPGQYVTDDFPVLSAGPTPHTPLEKWTFSITQGGETKKTWSWQEIQALPAGLVGLGYPPEWVKTERFGSTGGR